MKANQCNLELVNAWITNIAHTFQWLKYRQFEQLYFHNLMRDGFDISYQHQHTLYLHITQVMWGIDLFTSRHD